MIWWAVIISFLCDSSGWNSFGHLGSILPASLILTLLQYSVFLLSWRARTRLRCCNRHRCNMLLSQAAQRPQKRLAPVFDEGAWESCDSPSWTRTGCRKTAPRVRQVSRPTWRPWRHSEPQCQNGLWASKHIKANFLFEGSRSLQPVSARVKAACCFKFNGGWHCADGAVLHGTHQRQDFTMLQDVTRSYKKSTAFHCCLQAKQVLLLSQQDFSIGKFRVISTSLYCILTITVYTVSAKHLTGMFKYAGV